MNDDSNRLIQQKRSKIRVFENSIR